MNAMRPDPDALLRTLAPEGKRRGRLKVFLGAAPGVGKTCEMLSEAAQRREAGEDVVIGVIETHGRAETEARMAGFEIIPRRAIDHHGQVLHEMDLDAILARHPALVLIDELAHTNVAPPGYSAGSAGGYSGNHAAIRHDKRWQDVEEVLDAGIDVFSTLNVQHLESLNDLVASFTRVRVRETLPDRVLDAAEIEVVDIPPDELIARLKAGKVYVPQEASRALSHFFSKSNLSALRELALRRAARTVDAQMLDHLRAHAVAGTFGVGERVLVAVGGGPAADKVVRAGKRLADSSPRHGPRSMSRPPSCRPRRGPPRRGPDRHPPSGRPAGRASDDRSCRRCGAGDHADRRGIARDRSGSGRLGPGGPLVALGRACRALKGRSLEQRLLADTGDLALHVVPAQQRTTSGLRAPFSGFQTGSLALPGLLLSGLMVAAVTLLGTFIASLGNITNVALLYLLPVLLAASCFGLWTGIITALTSLLAYNFFFIPPLHTLTIADPQNIITAVVLLAVALAVSHMAGRLRDTAQFSRASAARSQTLAGFARRLTGQSATGRIAAVLCEESASLLGTRTVLLMPNPGGLPNPGACTSWPPARPRSRCRRSIMSSRNGRSTTAAPPGAARTRWARPNGCSCRSRRAAGHWPCSGWPTRMPGNRCAQTCCPCSPAFSTRPDWRSTAPGWRPNRRR
jgi:two-component system sensor histidine kinase KdpD